MCGGGGGGRGGQILFFKSSLAQRKDITKNSYFSATVVSLCKERQKLSTQMAL